MGNICYQYSTNIPFSHKTDNTGSDTPIGSFTLIDTTDIYV